VDVGHAPFAFAWVVAAGVLALCVLLLAMVRAPWKRFGSGEALNAWCGAIVALVVLWSIRAALPHGVVIHLLGVAALALVSGGALALVGGAIVVVLSAWLHGVPVASVATQFLCAVVVPVLVVLGVHRLAQRFLPPNLFVYTIVVAFFGAGASAVLAGLASAVSFVVAGVEPAAIFGEYVPYLLFLGFGEAMLTGMALTLAVVYRPQWVVTFDQDRYLPRGN